MKRIPVELLIPIFVFTAALGGGCEALKLCSRQFYQIYHVEKLDAVCMMLQQHTLQDYHSHPAFTAYLPRLRHLTVNLSAQWWGRHGLKEQESRDWRRSVGMEGARIINNNFTRLSDELFVDMLLLSEIVDRTPNLEYILIEVDTTKPEGCPRVLIVDRDQNAEISNQMRAGGWRGRIEIRDEILRTMYRRSGCPPTR